MKKLFFITILLIVGISSQTFARIPVPFCSSCEYIQEVADLPDSLYYLEDSQASLDLGYLYKQFWIVWLPIWNFDGQYCLYEKGNDEVYYEITKEELTELETAGYFKMSSNPISIWNKLGGKVIVIALIALIIWGYFSKSDEEEEEQPELAEQGSEEVKE